MSLMGFIQRLFVRRKLNVVVSVMPALLGRMFSARDDYSFGQVTRVLEMSKVSQSLWPYGYAAFCAPSEFARPELSGFDRDALRKELVQLFGLSGAHFTPSELRERFNPSGAAAGYNDTNGNSGAGVSGYGGD